MQVLVVLFACLGLSSAFFSPPVPTARPPARHAWNEQIKPDGLEEVSLRPAKQVGVWEKCVSVWLGARARTTLSVLVSKMND